MRADIVIRHAATIAYHTGYREGCAVFRPPVTTSAIAARPHRCRTFDTIASVGDTHAMRPAIANINIENLRHNYRLLGSRAGAAKTMAVVKANAYGHGLAPVSSALFDEGCRLFAVTDAGEGMALRELLPGAESIVLFSGIFDADDAGLACRHTLTPAIANDHQLRLLQSAGFHGSVWIKVNTGMQRLGADDPARLIDRCRSCGIEVAGIMSHLACADTPEHPLNRMQAEEFSTLCQQLDPELPASLLNSAGLVALPDQMHDFIRPGLALYGAEPVPAEPLGVKPVMQLTGQVMHVREIGKGVSLSYGASFTARDDMRIAVVSLGYGDGLPRTLSNCGQAYARGMRFPIVGRICMDYCLIDCTTKHLKPGDTVEFWGEKLAVSTASDLAGTIPYELFTGVATRVCRRAV
ncbi:MAG: alanine racemase [Mariprofundaceae bacterium]|nr:alanine racemase [Mariprofundaceae bacterium]